MALVTWRSSESAARLKGNWQRLAAPATLTLVLVFIVWRSLEFVTANWIFTTDDAYITLRYARHFADGHGIVWNPGESPPVEGYSNFSYVLLGALAFRLGIDPILLFKVLGIIAVGGTCVLLWIVTRTFVGPVAAMVPALLVTSYDGTWVWATSGLETPVYQLLAVGAIGAFVAALPAASSREARPSSSAALLAVAGVLVAAASMTRPEGPLIGLGVLVGLVAMQARRRGAGVGETVISSGLFLVPFAAAYGAYMAWRIQYFDRWLPNTVYCKALFSDPSGEILTAYATLASPFAVAAILHHPRRFDPRLLPFLIVPALYAIALRDVDPTVGGYNRHALTAWSLLLVPATVGFRNFCRWLTSGRDQTSDAAVVAGAALWIATAAGMTPATAADRAAEYATRSRDRAEVGAWLRTHLSAGEAYVVGDCGVIPFVAGGHAIDAYCLNNREATLPPIRGSSAAIVARIFELAPAWIVVHASSSERLIPRLNYGIYPLLVWDESFANYELRTRIGSPNSEYHYWIFRRRL